MIQIEKPKSSEYPEYCQKYFALTDATNFFDALEDTKISTLELMLSIAPDKEDYGFAKAK